ncbi:hypothetical protein MAPG_04066, partial [Magnaporthiopsis poae ATCC 64411]
MQVLACLASVSSQLWDSEKETGSSHHFPKLGFRLGGSSRDAAASPRTVSSRPSPAVTARRPKSLLQTSPVGSSFAKRPHRQRNVIRKRRRSGVRVSFNRSSSSAASLAGFRSRAAKTRTPGKDKKYGKQRSSGGKSPSGGQGRGGHGLAWGSVNGKAKGFQTWVGHILSPKDGTTSHGHQRIKPADISHPIPLLLPSDGDGSTPRKPVVPCQPQDRRYSLMQVPEEQSDAVRWVTVPESQDISDMYARVRGASTPARFSTEYAHVGPLDHGYDGHASSKENARFPAQKHSVIIRKHVGASHRDTCLTAGQDRQHAAQRPHRESRERVSVVPTLTCRQEKRFGLADPKVASTVSRTLSQQQRLSDVVTLEQSVLTEAPARSRSQQKKIDRFTRELHRYKSVHPKPPDSTPPEPPSRDSLRTVSALVPYHSEFEEAGLAVTSAEQMRLFSARRPDCRAANTGAVPAQTSSSAIGRVGEAAVQRAGAGPLPGASADRSLGRPCSIQRTPPGGIAGLAADPAPVTPEHAQTSPRKILPWLCEKQTESLPATDENATSARPIKGPQTPVARAAARVSIREPGQTEDHVARVEQVAERPQYLSSRLLDRRAQAGRFKRSAQLVIRQGRTCERQEDTRRNISSGRGSCISTAIRSQPTTIPEETEILDADRTTFGVNKPLPKTPGEAETSRAETGAGRHYGEDRASDTAAAGSSNAKKVAPSAPVQTDRDRGRGGVSSSPPRRANAWKYAIVTDSSLEKALDGIVSRLRELDDANRRLVCEIEKEKTPGDTRKISNTDKEPAPVAMHEEGRDRDIGASSSKLQLPPPVRIEDDTPATQDQPPPPPPPKDDVYRGAERKRPIATGPPGQMRRPGDDEGGESEWEDQASEDEREPPPPPPPQQQKKRNEQAPVDHHDRDISDRDVLKGLRLALAAACDEDYD